MSRETQAEEFDTLGGARNSETATLAGGAPSKRLFQRNEPSPEPRGWWRDPIFKGSVEKRAAVEHARQNREEAIPTRVSRNAGGAIGSMALVLINGVLRGKTPGPSSP